MSYQWIGIKGLALATVVLASTVIYTTLFAKAITIAYTEEGVEKTLTLEEETYAYTEKGVATPLAGTDYQAALAKAAGLIEAGGVEVTISTTGPGDLATITAALASEASSEGNAIAIGEMIALLDPGKATAIETAVTAAIIAKTKSTAEGFTSTGTTVAYSVPTDTDDGKLAILIPVAVIAETGSTAEDITVTESTDLYTEPTGSDTGTYGGESMTPLPVAVIEETEATAEGITATESTVSYAEPTDTDDSESTILLPVVVMSQPVAVIEETGSTTAGFTATGITDSYAATTGTDVDESTAPLADVVIDETESTTEDITSTESKVSYTSTGTGGGESTAPPSVYYPVSAN